MLPSMLPTQLPSSIPSVEHSLDPSNQPSVVTVPSSLPSLLPTQVLSSQPSSTPSFVPSQSGVPSLPTFVFEMMVEDSSRCAEGEFVSHGTCKECPSVAVSFVYIGVSLVMLVGLVFLFLRNQSPALLVSGVDGIQLLSWLGLIQVSWTHLLRFVFGLLSLVGLDINFILSLIHI